MMTGMSSPSILIVKLGAVGDCLHTLYALRALRLRYPDSRIGWVVEQKSLGVIENHPDLTCVHIFPRREISDDLRAGRFWSVYARLREFRRELRSRFYDVAIDFQDIFKSGIIAFLSGAPMRIGFRKWREANFLFMNRWIKSPPTAKHAIQKYFSLMRPLGIEDIPASVDIFVPDEKRIAVDAFFAENHLKSSRVIAVNPGASWPNKRLDPVKYAAAIEDLARDNTRCVVLWGPGEEPLVDEIVRSCKSSVLKAPKTDLKELYYLLKCCNTYLGNDSGPMHLAAAAGISVAAVFGPSDHVRVGPWTDKREIVSARVPCSPCWKRTCPLPKILCMDGIAASDLSSAVRRLLETT